MPRYEFECERCGQEVELLLSIARMDDPPPCDCSGKLVRTEIPSSQVTGSDKVFRMKLIMSDGSKVAAPTGRKYKGFM